MSWHVSLVGTAARVAEALDAENLSLSGPSGEEWAAAKPHLAALVKSNFGPAAHQPTVKLEASGHGSPTGGSCVVSLTTVGAKLV